MASLPLNGQRQCCSALDTVYAPFLGGGGGEKPLFFRLMLIMRLGNNYTEQNAIRHSRLTLKNTKLYSTTLYCRITRTLLLNQSVAKPKTLNISTQTSRTLRFSTFSPQAFLLVLFVCCCCCTGTHLGQEAWGAK